MPASQNPRGRVAAERGSSFLVSIENETREVGVGAHVDPRPVVGDWVEVEATGRISRVEPRSTSIARKVAGRETRQQVLVANVDRGFIVTVNDRDWSPRRLERYLVALWEGGVDPVILVNKVDVAPVDPELRLLLADVAIGVPVLEVSAATGTGLDSVRSAIPPGTTAVLLGSSGVGKSTLINRLTGLPAQPTATLGDDGRGRHTTSHRELFPLDTGGWLIDTPGLREFLPWASEEGVKAIFDEIEVLAGDCRFRDCQHQSEPGCAVKRAVDRGDLDPQRLASFDRLLAEQRALAARDGGAAAQERKRQDKVLTRAAANRLDQKYGHH
jgi:ribosome biogenesis GTPase